jgi:hypothetical protein
VNATNNSRKGKIVSGDLVSSSGRKFIFTACVSIPMEKYRTNNDHLKFERSHSQSVGQTVGLGIEFYQGLMTRSFHCINHI